MLLLVALAVLRSWHAVLPHIAIPLTIALAIITFSSTRYAGCSARRVANRSERAIAFAIWGLVLLHFIGVNAGCRRARVGQHPGRARAHRGTRVAQGAVVVIYDRGALWLSGLVEKRLHRARDATCASSWQVPARAAAGDRRADRLQAVGIDLTLLTVFGGALGVGIGLGLQKLAGNYIAGFAILLDKSITLGDMVTVDDRHGEVARSRRATSCCASRTASRRSCRTRRSSRRRCSTTRTRAAVAWSCRCRWLRRGRRARAGAAGRCGTSATRASSPAIAPQAFVIRFGDSGIDLELVLWINDPEDGQAPLRSAINLTILRRLPGRDPHSLPAAGAHASAGSQRRASAGRGPPSGRAGRKTQVRKVLSARQSRARPSRTGTDAYNCLFAIEGRGAALPE